MNQIKVPANWSKINRAKINRFLAKRFYGWLPAIAILVTAIVVIGTLTLALRLYMGPFPRGVAIFTLPALAGFMAISGLNSVWKQKLVRALYAAPIRTGDWVIGLDAQGVSNAGIPVVGVVEWSNITEVIDYKDTLLLLFSPIEYIPIPYANLPENVNRTDLLNQIAKWREAANV